MSNDEMPISVSIDSQKMRASKDDDRISASLSDAFRVAGLVATIMVVAIHYNTRRHIGDSGSVNALTQQFLTDGISRIAVPYFALVAGIMLFEGLRRGQTYQTVISKRSRTVLLPLILTGATIFLPEWIYRTHYLGVPMVNMPRSVIDAMWLDPWPVQLWFLRDLVVLVAIHPLILLAVKRTGILFTALISIFWLTNIEILPQLSGRPLISIETLFFFSLGATCSEMSDRIDNIFSRPSGSSALISLTAVVSFFALGVILDQNESLSFFQFSNIEQIRHIIQKCTIAIGTWQLTKWCYYLVNRNLLFLSQFSFFVFLFHTLPLNRIVVYTSDMVVADEWKFYFTFPLGTILTFVIAAMSRGLTPRLYYIFTGGR